MGIRSQTEHEGNAPSGRPTPNPFEAAERERTSLTRLMRLIFLVLFITVTVLTIIDTEALGPRLVGPGGVALKAGWYLVFIVAAVLAGVVIIIDALTTRKKISTLLSIFLGLVIALMSTYALGRIVDLLVDIYNVQNPGLVATAKILLGIALSYLAVVTILQTRDDLRLVIPYVEFSKQIRGPRPFIIDTSALIDARLADLAATGVIQSPLVIHEQVVEELQRLSDSGDKLKRARGRRGLDVIARLQRTAGIDLSIDQSTMPVTTVDQVVVALAQQLDGMVVTTDTGLARVASIRSIRVISVHELAAALKPSLIPGEQFTLRLVRSGEQPTQAVGYLEDGTMVVAEDGRPYLGQDVSLTVVTTLQTAGGRLIFARVAPLPGSEAPTAVLASPPPATPPVLTTDPPTAPFIDPPAADQHAPDRSSNHGEPAMHEHAKDAGRGDQHAAGHARHGDHPAAIVTPGPTIVRTVESAEPSISRAGPFPPKPGKHYGTPRNPRR